MNGAEKPKSRLDGFAPSPMVIESEHEPRKPDCRRREDFDHGS
jgi:hypothetical protein